MAQASAEHANVRLFATADTAQEAEVMLGALEVRGNIKVQHSKPNTCGQCSCMSDCAFGMRPAEHNSVLLLPPACIMPSTSMFYCIMPSTSMFYCSSSLEGVFAPSKLKASTPASL